MNILDIKCNIDGFSLGESLKPKQLISYIEKRGWKKVRDLPDGLEIYTYHDDGFYDIIVPKATVTLVDGEEVRTYVADHFDWGILLSQALKSLVSVHENLTQLRVVSEILELKMEE